MLKLSMVKVETTKPQLVPVRHETGDGEGGEIPDGNLQRERVPVTKR
jgi:hypothetical protein